MGPHRPHLLRQSRGKGGEESREPRAAKVAPAAFLERAAEIGSLRSHRCCVAHASPAPSLSPGFILLSIAPIGNAGERRQELTTPGQPCLSRCCFGDFAGYRDDLPWEHFTALRNKLLEGGLNPSAIVPLSVPNFPCQPLTFQFTPSLISCFNSSSKLCLS